MDLPQELHDEILDQLSLYRLPHNPGAETIRKHLSTLAACTLVCRAWLPRSSKHLLSAILLKTQERLVQFLAAVETSTRLETYVGRIVLHGLADSQEGLQDLKLLLQALPNLFSLVISQRSTGTPWQPNPLIFQTLRRDTIHELCISHRSMANWVLPPPYLRFFTEVNHLRILRSGNFADVFDNTQVQTHTMLVRRLTAYDVNPNMLRALSRIIVPSYLRRLTIEGERTFMGDQINVLNPLNDFIIRCGQNLEDIHIYLTRPGNLHSLSSCTRLHTVRLAPMTHANLVALTNSVLMWLPQSVHCLCINTAQSAGLRREDVNLAPLVAVLRRNEGIQRIELRIPQRIGTQKDNILQTLPQMYRSRVVFFVD